MILCKKLTPQEVLEIVAMVAIDTIPEGKAGDLSLAFDDDGGIEIFLEQEVEKKDLN